MTEPSTENLKENVRDINPGGVLSQFFERMYKDQDGWVYLASKILDEPGSWTKHFFLWPSQAEEITQFCLETASEREVYYSPALWKHDRTDEPIQRSDFKGSYHVWADYDGELPNSEKLIGIPSPSLQVRSSSNKNQHWYWELEHFETDPGILEGVSKRLAYATGADLSGWDCVQVLRPPGTLHHESKRKTRIQESTGNTHALEKFASIPLPPVGIEDIDVEKSNKTFTELMVKYAIPENQIEFILDNSLPRDRSGALQRIAYICAEVGMTNPEIYSCVEYKDDVWKKWSKRNPEARKKAIIGTIKNARIKWPEGGATLHDIDEEIPWMSLRNFKSMDLSVDWIVPGYIQKNGIFFLSSDAGVGKTHMTLLIAMHMACGKKFLNFEFSRPMKIAIVQMEMSPHELSEELIDKILPTFPDELHDMILDNLDVIPKGSSINLKSPRVRDMILQRLDQFKPEGIFWDSFQVAMGGKINESEDLNDAFDFIKKEVGIRREIFNWFIHHNRKDASTQTSRKKPKELDDLYGGQAIAAVATMVMGLWRENKEDPVIDVTCLKARFAPEFPSFKIRRPQGGTGFEIVEKVSAGIFAQVDSPIVPPTDEGNSSGFPISY